MSLQPVRPKTPGWYNPASEAISKVTPATYSSWRQAKLNNMEYPKSRKVIASGPIFRTEDTRRIGHDAGPLTQQEIPPKRMIWWTTGNSRNGISITTASNMVHQTLADGTTFDASLPTWRFPAPKHYGYTTVKP